MFNPCFPDNARCDLSLPGDSYWHCARDRKARGDPDLTVVTGSLFRLPANGTFDVADKHDERGRGPTMSKLCARFSLLYIDRSMEISRSRRPPGFYPFFYHGNRTMQLLRNHEGGERPQTLFQLQVSSFFVSSVIAIHIHPVLWSQDRLLLRQPPPPLSNTITDLPRAVQGVPKVTLEDGSQSRLPTPNTTQPRPSP